MVTHGNMYIGVTFVLLNYTDTVNVYQHAWTVSTAGAQVIVFDPNKVTKASIIGGAKVETPSGLMQVKSVVTTPNLANSILGKYVVPLLPCAYGDRELISLFTSTVSNFTSDIISPLVHDLVTDFERYPLVSEPFTSRAYSIDFLRSLPTFDFSLESFLNIKESIQYATTVSCDPNFFLFTNLSELNI